MRLHLARMLQHLLARAVTAGAQWLPVVLVPEQHQVAAEEGAVAGAGGHGGGTRLARADVVVGSPFHPCSGKTE